MQLDDLYQELILDHYRSPRNHRKLADAETLVDEENPTCGDHIKLSAAVKNGTIERVEVECAGCAICTASASMMTEMVTGRAVSHARHLVAGITSLMRGDATAIADEEIGDMVALKGVAQYPLRVKCATMSWHALDAALKKLNA